MIEYKVTYVGDSPRLGATPDEAARLNLRVSCGAVQGIVAAVVTGSAAHSLRDEDWRTAAVLEAIEETELRLESGLLSSESGLGFELVLDGIEGVEQLGRRLQQPKRCLWQKTTDPRGLLCSATGDRGAQPTSRPRCASCEMPDARLLCAAFTHPRMGGATIGEMALGIYPMPDPHVQAMYSAACCDDGHEPSTWSDCTPASRTECWHRIVSVGQLAPVPDPEAPRRVIDEIGYLRLVYADRFQLSRSKAKAFWPKSDESAVSSLRNDCDSPARFRTHVVALCDMLLAIRPHAELREDERSGGDGRPVNGITALERVLKCRFGGGLPGVAFLKALNEARNRFSHDERKELVAALRTLGLEHYPPQSWQLAWWQVSASVAEGLAQVRSAIQNTTPSELTEI